MKKLLLLCASIISISALANPKISLPFDAPQKILFGSCMESANKMPIFDAINREKNTDLFILLGDNIYGDTTDMKVMAAKYKKLNEDKGFHQMFSTTPTIAIWDDHDMGANDGGSEYPQKEASRKLMLDFFHEPKGSPRYTRPDGIYTSYMYGHGDKTVQVIMPDLRWNREKLDHVSNKVYQQVRQPKQMGPYIADPTGKRSMLGEKQWQWLEKELKKPAKIKIIASSLQLIPEFTGWEGWPNFPHDRNRLLALIKKYKINGVIIISGDTHWGEISEMKKGLDYPLWEVTSSGLTQEWKYISPNVYRVGNPKPTKNYGELLINWKLKDPTIQLTLKDVNGNVFTSQRVNLSSISPYH